MAKATQENRMMQITKSPFKDLDYLLINKLSATEGLSSLFRYDVELLFDHEEITGTKPEIIDMQDILGQELEITITQMDTNATTRTFHGIINSFSQGNRDKRFSYYYATIVPSVWLLTQNSQSRIFQQMTVKEIVQKVLADFDPIYEWQGDYIKRNYCVQYRETDFDFISRLMEEEGIYYYFKFADNTHKMIVSDISPSNHDCTSKKDIEFLLHRSETEGFVSAIKKWRVDYRLQTGKVTFWDFNFQTPKKNLEGTDLTKAADKIAGTTDLELYDYPGGHSRKVDGIDPSGGDRAADLHNLEKDKDKVAKMRIQELDARYRVIDAFSDCCSLTAGHRFNFINHPNSDFNTQYVITTVTHEIEQSPDYETDEEVLSAYGNNFNCIESKMPFRPERKTKKPVVRGSQTAVVVGLKGEEIYTDKYGRVKVQFFWDRDGKLDDNSSCWIRVGQSWAGKNWGMMFIPRIGMEVIVSFLEGDPDQPIITGCVYNAETMPPYELPASKTMMAIKSDTTTGGSGFNEIRFEDKKDSEQIFIHSQKDVDIRNKNDRRETVGNDFHFTVQNDRFENTNGNEHHTVDGEQRELIKGDHSLKINSNEKVKIDGDSSLDIGGSSRVQVAQILHEQAGQEIHIKAGVKLVLEAPMIVIKASCSMDINGGGMMNLVAGLVGINSGGGQGSGSEVNLVPPDAPKDADPAAKADPGSKAKLERASNARKEKRHKEDEKKKSWIKGVLLNEAGKPVPGVRYKVTTPDNRTASGSTDKDGKFHVKGFDPGECKISFPEHDKDAWEES